MIIVGIENGAHLSAYRTYSPARGRIMKRGTTFEPLTSIPKDWNFKRRLIGDAPVPIPAKSPDIQEMLRQDEPLPLNSNVEVQTGHPIPPIHIQKDTFTRHNNIWS
jgi:hypothetical protein